MELPYPAISISGLAAAPIRKALHLLMLLKAISRRGIVDCLCRIGKCDTRVRGEFDSVVEVLHRIINIIVRTDES
jgi:hypothetical protein